MLIIYTIFFSFASLIAFCGKKKMKETKKPTGSKDVIKPPTPAQSESPATNLTPEKKEEVKSPAQPKPEATKLAGICPESVKSDKEGLAGGIMCPDPPKVQNEAELQEKKEKMEEAKRKKEEEKRKKEEEKDKESKNDEKTDADKKEGDGEHKKEII